MYMYLKMKEDRDTGITASCAGVLRINLKKAIDKMYPVRLKC